MQRFGQACLPDVEPEKILRAARVAKDIRTYDDLVRSEHPDAGHGLPVQLTDEEKRALKREKDVVFPERGMLIVVLTVSLAAFLQGQVQSSINGASLFPIQLGLSPSSSAGNDGGFNAVTASTKPPDPTLDVWRLGAMNASPFLFAAALGCPLALPINDLVGRRGAMVVAALLILASSLGSAFVNNWYSLFGVRIINGLGRSSDPTPWDAGLYRGWTFQASRMGNSGSRNGYQSREHSDIGFRNRGWVLERHFDIGLAALASTTPFPWPMHEPATNPRLRW